MSTTPSCCSVAKTLDAKRLAKLDAELRDPEHRSFAKLSAAYGVPRSGVEKHKKVCLKLGVPKPHLDPASIPKSEPVGIRVENTSKASKNTSKDAAQNTLDIQDVAAPRAPVSAICAKSRAERVAWIVQEMTLGRPNEKPFDIMREVPILAQQWGLSEETVREYARSAEDALQLNLGDVEAAKTQGILFWTRLRDAAFEAGDFRAAAVAQTGIDRIRGAIDDGKKVVVNVVQSPAFMAMVDTALTALRPWPPARDAVVEAWRETAKELQQPEPTVLLTTGEELMG